MTYPYEFALFAETNRNRVYDKVMEALERAATESAVTQAQIAKTIGRKPSQVSAWLSGPSNWTLDTVSNLLRAINASMDYAVVFDSDRIQSNLKHPALIEPVNTGTAPRPELVVRLEGTQRWQIPLSQPPRPPVLASGISNIEIVTAIQT
jgi:plasmid maintenance system antidote protein VapI